jgi:hypothetical protein
MKTKMVKVDEVVVNSLIKKNFSDEFLRKVYDIYSNDYISIVDKTIMFDDIFTKEFGHRKDYRRIGEGTNRFVCLLDNHIIKVAYNYLAYIDNMNEVAQSKYKSMYLAQAYETNGIILVSEYVTVMDKMEFLECQTQIKDILRTLEKDFLGINHKDNKCFILGDMGMSEKNYGNWGKRMNGDIVVLDYGYLYEMSEREWKRVAKCPKCGSSLEYTSDYSELHCTAHDSNKCDERVNYTSIRNVYGYSKIIDDIVKGLNNDRYIKFNDKGQIKVDVMKEEVIEEADRPEFKMPEDIEEKISRSKDIFYLITESIKSGEDMSVDEYNALKYHIINNKELYHENLYPFVLASINMNSSNVESHIKDFNKFADALYKDIHKKLKGEFDREHDDFDDEDDIPDIYEEGGFTARGFEAELERSNSVSVEDGTKAAKSILDFMDLDIFNIINAEDPAVRDIDDNMSFADTMSMLDNAYSLVNESNNKKDEDEEKEFYLAEKKLKEAYTALEDSLTELISSVYRAFNCELDSEYSYTTGDVYSTYLNGDTIDLDYSPRTNAKNILGGWEPNKFAFLLYRHLLIKYDHDVDVVSKEFQALYRVDDEVKPPKDLYSRTENRDYVIMQIMHRFEDSMKPTRYSLIQNLGDGLNDYYKALDRYYDLYKPAVEDIDIDDPDYYLKIAESKDHLSKELRDAKEDLKDELIDRGIRLEDVMNEYKVAYYYDLEPLMDSVELNLMEMIQRLDFRGVTDVQSYIIDKYYMEYNSIIPYSSLDPFKYDSSYVKLEGSKKYPKLTRPKLKATLVPKNSTVDTFKPEIFNNNKQTIVTVEQTYNITFGDTDVEQTNLVAFESKLTKKDLYYTKSDVRKYSVKRSNDNMRYGLTEKEIKIIDEYEEMLRYHNIKDEGHVVKNTIVELLQEKYEFGEETRELMMDLAKSDLTEAYANRLFKINVFELSRYMTRLEYLAHVE